VPTVDQIIKALALIESNANWAAWGDGGRAMGRWQVHPDRLWFEARRFDLEPKLGETWDSFVARVLQAIVHVAMQTQLPLNIAMYWHLGHWTYPDKPDWDSKYAARFVAALARVEEGGDDNG
jgi:hypothetical protein